MKSTDFKKQDRFTEEYNEVVHNDKNSILTTREWKKNGDFFKKFSLYENYTPVETSANTVLISE